jgi:integrase
MPAQPCPYVHNNPRSANLYYVRDVPADIRAHVGKSKWKVSLGTAIRAEAVRKALPLAAEHDRQIRAARAPDLVSTLQHADQERLTQSGGVNGHLNWLDERACEASHLAHAAEELREWAAEDGPPAEIPDRDWTQAKLASLDAERASIERHLAREGKLLNGLGLTARDVSGTHPALAHALETAAPDPDAISLKDVLDRWVAQRAPAAPDQYRYPVRLFADLYGAIAVQEITKTHIRDFRDALQRRPRAGGQTFGDSSFSIMLKRAADENLPRVSPITADKDFRCFKTLLGFAVDEGYLEHNPALGIKLHNKKQKFAVLRETKRRPISPDELARLLRAAEQHFTDDDAWFVRLLVYTGARPEEIAQLASTDFVTVQRHLCVRLHDEGDNKLKSPSAYRIIPVHPKLVECRIQEFVDRRRTTSRIFSKMTANGQNRRYANMQRRLTTLMRKKARIEDTRVVPYSIRHAFKDAMRIIGAPEEVVERIMGHSSPSRVVARGYGNPDQVALLAKWMAEADPLNDARIVPDAAT